MNRDDIGKLIDQAEPDLLPMLSEERPPAPTSPRRKTRGRPPPIPDGLSPEEETEYHVQLVFKRFQARFGKQPTPGALRRVASVYARVAERLRELAK